MFHHHPHPPPHHGAPPPPPHHAPHEGPPPPPHFVHHEHNGLTEDELCVLEGLIDAPEVIRSFSRIFAYAPPEIGAVLTAVLHSHRLLAEKCDRIESLIMSTSLEPEGKAAQDPEGGIDQ